MPHQQGIKAIAQNRKAFHDYFVEEKVECGIALFGTEVKSIRLGKVNLKESWAQIRKGEIWIEGMHISPYEQGNRYNVDSTRPRKLLLHKREIMKLTGYITKKGLTIVPLQMYLNEEGRAKLEIAVARGKKNYDKRESIAKRDAARDMDRAMRRRR